MLLVAFGKSREEDLAKVGLAVAVFVLGIENIRSARDQHALPPRQDPGGKTQAIKKCRLLVVDSIAVLVFEITDNAAGFPLPSTPSG